MIKLNEVEVVEKTPSPNLKYGERMLPNSFHKVETHKVPTADCNKIYYTNCIPCPWINQYVAAVECETCKHGKAGNYSEGWILCNYESSDQTKMEDK